MPNFEKITAQHIKSDSGFEIIPGGRTADIYQEDTKRMTYQVEYGRTQAEKVCITLWPGAFSRWDDGTAVSIEGQHRIEKNVRDAMDFLDLDLLIWDPRTEKYLKTSAYHGRLTATWS